MAATITVLVERAEIHAADAAWGHQEPVEMPRPGSMVDLIDAVVRRYSYNGVRFINPMWVVSHGGAVIALTGTANGARQPTDVFGGPGFDGATPIPESLGLFFAPVWPGSTAHGARLLADRAAAGSSIALAFVEEHVRKLRSTTFKHESAQLKADEEIALLEPLRRIPPPTATSKSTPPGWFSRRKGPRETG